MLTRAIGATAALLLTLAACGGDDDDSGGDPAGTTSSESVAPGATPPPSGPGSPPTETGDAVREGADPATNDVIPREVAEQAALAAVGEGRVTWSGPEDDRGAAWEVEITRPDGSEVDVLVAADGSILKIVGKFGQAPPLSGGGSAPPAGVITQTEAEQAALAAVGEGRVTWAGREDERGAAWEIEITRPDGTEVDVLVAADGTIVD